MIYEENESYPIGKNSTLRILGGGCGQFWLDQLDDIVRIGQLQDEKCQNHYQFYYKKHLKTNMTINIISVILLV